MGKCKQCGQNKTIRFKTLCRGCYNKNQNEYRQTNFTKIPLMGLGLGSITSKFNLVFTDGATSSLKNFTKKETQNILNKCINNPQKYLRQNKNISALSSKYFKLKKKRRR